MGYKMKSFMVGVWQKIKILIILAILAGVGYGGWLAWGKFIKKTQSRANRGGANRISNIEKQSGSSVK
ncbi:MAG: hypothetical protein L3J71_07470 [Victivallaceae bacterium]|nr:hypothetical protein [Victivallaceae bacterium]